MYLPSVKALSGNLAKISILTVLFVTVSTTSANGWFGKNSNKGGGWGNSFSNNGYDDNDWPEWTPMYWMEEFLGDDDNNYNYGRYRSAPNYANRYGANQPYGRVDQRPLVSPYAVPYGNFPYATAPSYTTVPHAVAPRVYSPPLQPQSLYGAAPYGARVPNVVPRQFSNNSMIPYPPNRSGNTMPFLGGGRSFGNNFNTNNFSRPFSSGGFPGMSGMTPQRGFGGGFPSMGPMGMGSMYPTPSPMGGFGGFGSPLSPMSSMGSPMSAMTPMSPMSMGTMGMPGMSPMGGFGSPMSSMSSPMSMGTMGMPGMSPMSSFGGSPFGGGSSSFMPFR